MYDRSFSGFCRAKTFRMGAIKERAVAMVLSYHQTLFHAGHHRRHRILVHRLDALFSYLSSPSCSRYYRKSVVFPPGSYRTLLRVLSGFILFNALQDYFYFDWNPPGTTVPIPITRTVHFL